MLAFVCLFAGVRPWEALPAPTSCRKVQLELAPASWALFFKNMENVRIFCFCSFYYLWGQGKKKKDKKKKVVKHDAVVFKAMPVLNVHISYGPGDDFLGGTGKRRLPWDEGVLCCSHGSKLCWPL